MLAFRLKGGRGGERVWNAEVSKKRRRTRKQPPIASNGPPLTRCHSLKNGGNFCAVIIMIMLFMFKYVGKKRYVQCLRTHATEGCEPNGAECVSISSKRLIEKLASLGELVVECLA